MKEKLEAGIQKIESSKISLIIIITALLLIGLLLFSVKSVLSPFLILFAIEYLLYQVREIKFVRTIMWLSIIIFVIWFVFELSNLLIPFIIAILFAYILNPLINYFEKKRVKRWLSSLIVVLLLLSLVTLIIIFFVPIAIQQFNSIIVVISDFTKELVRDINEGTIFAWLSNYGIDINHTREKLSQELAPRIENILKSLLSAVLGFISSISAIITQIINIIIIPFILFYFLKDFNKITEKAYNFIPKDKRESVTFYLMKIDQLIGRYLRGAITVAFIHGLLIGILLAIFGIKYPVLLGMTAGILSIIPYFGLIVSLILSVLVATFSGDPIWLKILYVLGIFGLLQILEASIISPNILGKQVGLHPVLLILSLLVFGYFLGFIGLLIAVPIIAILIMILKEWEIHREQNNLGIQEKKVL